MSIFHQHNNNNNNNNLFGLLIYIINIIIPHIPEEEL